VSDSVASMYDRGVVGISNGLVDGSGGVVHGGGMGHGLVVHGGGSVVDGSCGVVNGGSGVVNWGSSVVHGGSLMMHGSDLVRVSRRMVDGGGGVMHGGSVVDGSCGVVNGGSGVVNWGSSVVHGGSLMMHGSDLVRVSRRMVDGGGGVMHGGSVVDGSCGVVNGGGMGSVHNRGAVGSGDSLVVDGSGVNRGSVVNRGGSVVHGSSVNGGSVVNRGSGVVNWGGVHGSSVMDRGSGLVHGGSMAGLDMGAIVVNGRGVVVNTLGVVRGLVVRVEITHVAIVVVHLEDEAAILDVGLAAHEERRVVLEAPVVASVPLLLIEVLEVISPSQLELFSRLVVIVDLDIVVLGVPWHVSVIEVVIPWGPAGSPEVHHELSRHVQEVHVLSALSLSHEVVVDVPADVVRGPLDGVSVPIGVGVEASGVVVVLGAIPPDDIHAVGVLMDGGHELNVDLIPAVGPVLGRVCEKGLHSAHLARVLHFHDELAVVEPLLGANLTGEVIGLGDARDHQSSQLLHL